MRGLLALLAGALLTLGGQALAGDKQKVIYHINGGEAQQQAAAMGNIRNHINALGAENLDIKVVMHGDGLSLVLLPEHQGKTKMKSANADQNMQARIDGLKADGVQFQVCANTLKGRDIPKDALYSVAEEDIIPSGVAQLSILQVQGYTYIKP
jgi:intracellular sulfur oxidation DsrE/DsrF family protein